jgi:tetratricopeptide (TPR) repeat protein
MRHLDRLQGRGSGAVVLLAGEPGIGKTTLLELLEAEAQARRVAVFVGRSPAATGAPSLWPWTQVVEAVAATLDDHALQGACAGAARRVVHLSPALGERIGHPLPITGDNPQTMRFLLYEAVSAFLRQASAGPTLLLLDDLHWADPPSLELLSYLTPSLAGRELLVVAAFRDLPAERTPELDATLATLSREDTVDEMVLRGLDSHEVAELWSHLRQDAADESATDDALVSLLHERTGGNPFFVRQLGHLLLEDAANDGAALSTTVPSGVRHVISSRLRELSEQATRLLEAAALLGREFDLRVAAGVAAMTVEDALDACDEAGRHGLLDSHDAGYHFVHALVQEAVVEALPPGRTARLHAAALTELERVGAPVDRLADHSWRARDLVGSRGVAHHRAAAQAAMSVFAYERAELYLRRALDLVRRSTTADPHTELTILLSLFQLIATNRGWGANEAREVVARARELAAAGALHPDSVRLWWSLWLYLLDRDDAKSGAEVATTLGELAATCEDGASVVAAHHAAVFSRLDEGRVDAARAELRAARAAVDRTPNRELAAFDEHLGVMVLLSEGYLAALEDNVTAHRTAAESAVALADADGRPFPRAIARTLAATSAVFLPDPGYVQRRAAEALDLSTRFGFGWLETSARCAAACANAQLGGDIPAAARQISDTLAQHREVGRVGNVSAVLVMLAEVRRAAGQLEEARACLQQAVAEPGPYRAVMTDHLRRRLHQLE